MNKIKTIIVLIWILDVIWIGIVIPTLPGLAQYYWVSEHMITYWITVYALASFLVTPLLGQWSDNIWRKLPLVICVIGTFLSVLLIVFTHSFRFFLIWRIINWLTWWNISILQSTLSDISKTPQERKINMWLMWAMFWTWFILWPLIWALLLSFGVMVPYWFMAVFALVEIFVLILFFKETHVERKITKLIRNPFKQILIYIKKPAVNLFILSFLVLATVLSIYQSVFPLFMTKYFGVNGQFSWYVLAWFWVLIVISQVFLLKKFWLKYFSLNQLLYISNIWLFVVFVALSFVKPLRWFVAFLTLMVPFQTILNPVYQWEIIEKSEEHLRWQAIWVMASVQSISMFVWPLIWWFLLMKDWPIFWISAILITISIWIIVKIMKKNVVQTV